MASLATSTPAAAAGPRPRPDRPHVVLVPSPGVGHLMPMAELARRLVSHHALAATLVTFNLSGDPDAKSAAVLSSLRAANVSTATLPAVPLDDLPDDASIETVLFEVIGRSIPHLRAFLRDVGSTAGAPLAALVPDFFATAALPLASELGVPAYIFFPSNLSSLSVMRSAVELHDGAGAGEYRDLPDPLPLPGGVSLRREDLPSGFRDSKESTYAQLIDAGRQYRTAAGILANAFYEMDPATVEEFKKAAEQGRFPPAYPVGPFVRSSSDEGSVSSPCIEWLDRQPTGSVVYVSFGSAGTLSVEQTAELAAGLENSGHRFLWIVRMSSLNGEHSDDMGRNYCDRGDENDNDPLAWLPEGFLERTRGRGLAVSSWAPQVSVLSHPATAAFVSHCGWNSTLESISSGVPMVAWPLFAEQRVNAVDLSEKVGVALRLRVRPDDGLVGREEIAAVVRELMEGEDGRAVRRRTGDLQQAADLAWAPDGSSRRSLEEVVSRWKAGAIRRAAV
ncbi:UDP-glycosyltransferase 72B1 [Zea mays]|uniref:Glycosyltransferase n=1 Tax=Zea mays TaxID=4577 RepID=A0A3L6F4R7_MAIZE|nr:UDP-glycosyltransferase 72B1 [Zea mays]